MIQIPAKGEAKQSYNAEAEAYLESSQLAEQLFRRVSRKGAKLGLGVALRGKPGIWPIRAFPADAYQWETVISPPLRMAHINLQEHRAVLVAIKYRTRMVSEVHRCTVHVVDSLASTLPIEKGRSSSFGIFT